MTCDLHAKCNRGAKIAITFERARREFSQRRISRANTTNDEIAGPDLSIVGHCSDYANSDIEEKIYFSCLFGSHYWVALEFHKERGSFGKEEVAHVHETEHTSRTCAPLKQRY